jgi:hypothetical protein
MTGAGSNRAAIGVAAVAAVGLAGCSASVSVGEHLNNPDKGISGLLHPTPKSVKCPSDISAKAGTKFNCHVVAADGSKATVSVLEYSKGHVRIVAINGRPVGTSSATATSTGSGTATAQTSTTTG